MLVLFKKQEDWGFGCILSWRLQVSWRHVVNETDETGNKQTQLKASVYILPSQVFLAETEFEGKQQEEILDEEVHLELVCKGLEFGVKQRI